MVLEDKTRQPLIQSLHHGLLMTLCLSLTHHLPPPLSLKVTSIKTVKHIFSLFVPTNSCNLNIQPINYKDFKAPQKFSLDLTDHIFPPEKTNTNFNVSVSDVAALLGLVVSQFVSTAATLDLVHVARNVR